MMNVRTALVRRWPTTGRGLDHGACVRGGGSLSPPSRARVLCREPHVTRAPDEDSGLFVVPPCAGGIQGGDRFCLGHPPLPPLRKGGEESRAHDQRHHRIFRQSTLAGEGWPYPSQSRVF